MANHSTQYEQTNDRRLAVFELSRSKATLSENPLVKQEVEELTSTNQGEISRYPFPFTASYQWELQSDSQQSNSEVPADITKSELVVVERMKVSHFWIIFAYLLIYPVTTGISHLPLASFPPLLVLGLFLIHTGYGLYETSPLATRLSEQSVDRSHTVFTAPNSLVALAGIVLLIDVYVTGTVGVTVRALVDISILAIFAGLITIELLTNGLQTPDPKYGGFPYGVAHRLLRGVPELAGGYSLLVFLATLPILVFDRQFGKKLPDIPIENLPAHLPFIISVLTILAFLYWKAMRSEMFYTSRSSILNPQEQDGSNRHWTGIGLAILSGGILLYSLGSLWLTHQHTLLTSPPLKTGTIVIVVVAVLPGCYFMCGAVFQLWKHIRWVGYLLVNTSYHGQTDRVDAKLMFVDTAKPVATSLSLGIREYVIVSDGMREMLSEAELKAVIEHEEAHIRFNDALFDTIIPLVASITLTGRNIWYNSKDIKIREFRADIFVNDSEAVIRALQKLEKGIMVTDEFELESTTPEFIIFSRLHRTFDRIFAAYFGPARAVHPSIDERISHLLNDQRSDKNQTGHSNGLRGEL